MQKKWRRVFAIIFFILILDFDMYKKSGELSLMHNAKCKIHNYGYFSVETEKFKTDCFFKVTK